MREECRARSPCPLSQTSWERARFEGAPKRTARMPLPANTQRYAHNPEKEG